MVRTISHRLVPARSTSADSSCSCSLLWGARCTVISLFGGALSSSFRPRGPRRFVVAFLPLGWSSPGPGFTKGLSTADARHWEGPLAHQCHCLCSDPADSPVIFVAWERFPLCSVVRIASPPQCLRECSVSLHDWLGPSARRCTPAVPKSPFNGLVNV